MASLCGLTVPLGAESSESSLLSLPVTRLAAWMTFSVSIGLNSFASGFFGLSALAPNFLELLMKFYWAPDSSDSDVW